MPRLLVNPDSPEAWSIDLQPGTISLGRSSQNDFPIEHPSVSSSHCQITLTPEGVQLKDLGSTAGTFVNEELVEEARLQPGQMVRLGDIRMRFESEKLEDKPAAVLPPLPPRIAPLPTAGRSTQCKFHPQTAARFICRKCNRAYCDLCITTRVGTGPPRHFCRHCGSECQSLQQSRPEPAPPPPGFFSLLPAALVYPFQGSGVMLLVAGTAFFFIVGYLPLIGLLLTGYLFAYAKSIITATVEGRKELPDWPDFTNWKDDILVPYLQLLALMVLCFGPAFVVRLWHPGTETETRIGYFAALGFGAFFAPMGMLALAMFDTVAALNPIALSWSILRVPLPYLMAAVAFEAVLVVYWFAAEAIGSLIPVPFVPQLISSFFNLYVIGVGMRILGLLYMTHQEEFGWFSRLRR